MCVVDAGSSENKWLPLSLLPPGWLLHATSPASPSRPVKTANLEMKKRLDLIILIWPLKAKQNLPLKVQVLFL
jgi:hypothetical protein